MRRMYAAYAPRGGLPRRSRRRCDVPVCPAGTRRRRSHESVDANLGCNVLVAAPPPGRSRSARPMTTRCVWPANRRNPCRRPASLGHICLERMTLVRGHAGRLDLQPALAPRSSELFACMHAISSGLPGRPGWRGATRRHPAGEREGCVGEQPHADPSPAMLLGAAPVSTRASSTATATAVTARSSQRGARSSRTGASGKKYSPTTAQVQTRM